MSHSANIRAALSLAYWVRNEPLPEGRAHDLAQETISALTEMSLAWYYANLDRRCGLPMAELAKLPELRLR